MGDLSSNCGCGCDQTSSRCVRDCGCGCTHNTGNNNSCLWIILLLIFCGGCGGNSFGNGCNDSCLWIILLLVFCGGCGGNSFGNNCGCNDCCC